MIRILALPRFTPLAAGCRYRIYSYLNYLRDQGFSIDVAPFLGDDYLHAMYQGRRKSYLSIASSYFNRVAQLLKLNRYDLVWIHWEALPWVPAWIESLLLKNGHRVIVDYDDALFHRYDSHRHIRNAHRASSSFQRRAKRNQKNRPSVLPNRDCSPDMIRGN